MYQSRYLNGSITTYLANSLEIESTVQYSDIVNTLTMPALEIRHVLADQHHVYIPNNIKILLFQEDYCLAMKLFSCRLI